MAGCRVLAASESIAAPKNLSSPSRADLRQRGASVCLDQRQVPPGPLGLMQLFVEKFVAPRPKPVVRVRNPPPPANALRTSVGADAMAAWISCSALLATSGGGQTGGGFGGCCCC